MSQNKEQPVAGMRDNDIGKDGMGMFIAVTENAQYTKVRFFLLSCPEINDRTAVVVVNVAFTLLQKRVNVAFLLSKSCIKVLH